MGFPGTWMTESESMVYRVVPKCACSTIGQVMYFSDNGVFFDGDIHDAQYGLHKWALDHSKEPIERTPYSRTACNASYIISCSRGKHFPSHKKRGIDHDHD